jgi:hypothetical protein
MRGDRIELELTNDGAKTAVAWTIQVVGLPPVDGRPPRIHIGQDLYPQLIFPARPPIVGPLPAGERAVVTSFPATTYPGASFVARCVVYSDGTAVGDEERIGDIFKRRAADARAWKDVSATLDEVAKGRISRASVEAAIRTIEAGTDRDSEGAHQSAVRNLRRFLESAWALQSSVEDLAAHTRKYGEGAASHSLRR